MSFEVDLAALDQVGKGMEEVIATLRAEGLGVSDRSAMAVLDWCLSSREAGHDGLADATDDFYNRVRYELRALIERTEADIANLRDTRSTYQKAEDAVGETLSEVMNTLFGARKPAQPQQGGQ